MKQRLKTSVEFTVKTIKKVNEVFRITCIIGFCFLIDAMILGGIFTVIWFTCIGNLTCRVL